MKYSNYSAEDLALDRAFQKWVLNADEESDQFWNQWMTEHPQKKPHVDEAIELVRLANLSPDSDINADYLEVWQRLRKKAGQDAAQRKRRAYQYAGLAASLTIFAAFVAWFLLFRTADPVVEIACGYGETKEVVLADGTKVTLNTNSCLRYSGRWETKSMREVYMEGEAFFEVVKTPGKKGFVVHTPGHVDVQVLGTEFNVNARRSELEVYLQSGKVNISLDTETVSMTPGQHAVYDKEAKKIEVQDQSKEAAERMLGWKSDLFIYDDIALPLIAYDIEDYYGWKVVLTDPKLRNKRFTAKIPRNDANVLFKVLSETLNIHIERKDDQVIMSPAH